jgi:CRISPR/Cas system-associated exonuclease Cas4 (RecB family)
MELGVKRPDRIVPDYSLTGDLLSYKRCGLQYRYYNASSLPPSRPVQMWYGEFIHGVLEAAFRIWRGAKGTLPFPWPYTTIPDDAQPEAPPAGLAAHDLRAFAWPIEEALMFEGKRARSRRARIAAYRRAEVAVNLLGPHLFPLIADAEQKVLGSRVIPPLADGREGRSTRYALRGIIDVLTNVELAVATPDNIICKVVKEACKGLTGTYEVIVDYKGSHRPATKGDPHWELGEWQVQTYAWLRQRQPKANPVAAGILIYINELAPGADDLRRMRRAIESDRTDVAPERGDPDDYALKTWKPGTDAKLSEAFRFHRAIRVIPVTDASIANATAQFDKIVAEIEGHVLEEFERGSIGAAWPATCEDEATCAACDFRHFCDKSLADKAAADAGGDDDLI